MKRQLTYLLTSALLLAAGCSNDTTTPSAEGFGTLAIQSAADGWIDTRAEMETVPAGSDFALRITGDDFDRSWTTVGEFNDSQTYLERGNYTAHISHGTPLAEGVGKPYFTGSKSFLIIARTQTTITIDATLANSQIFVRATEQFLRYFHDAKFVVTTMAGNKFDFAPGSTTPGEVICVPPATRITVNGTARRQSQTGESEGLQVKFPEQVLEATTVRTRHTFTFDAKDSGSATLTITLGEDYVETREFTVELNDAALPDEE